MVANFLAGGAVVNAIAGQVGAQVVVVDVGMAAPSTGLNGLVDRKVRPGTADMTAGPAMTRDEVEQAIEVGATIAYELIDAGHRCLLTGDMGVANTTASAALVAGLTGASPAEVTGHGAGIDSATYIRKVDVIRRALELHRPDPADPIGALAAVGGLEHAALVGYLLAAAGARIPVLLDGVIACSAALVANTLAPNVRGALIAGHESVEPGAARALRVLQLEPLLRMRMRLGEGSGAALALPVVQAAVRVLTDVATFDGAGVTDKH
jgi:nicotinate-nucleotide--dimethylbenzimidazole phosphoribosyltransferase